VDGEPCLEGWVVLEILASRLQQQQEPHVEKGTSGNLTATRRCWTLAEGKCHFQDQITKSHIQCLGFIKRPTKPLKPS
jgi:hypothetical protein